MPDYDPIYLTFNEKPAAILNGMRSVLQQRGQVESSLKKRRYIPLILFLAGFPFILVDVVIRLLGYSVCVFSLAAPAFWLAALLAYIKLRRTRTKQIPPQYQTARQILYTLRDDVAPGRNFFGHLDLTGAMQPEKVQREVPNALGLVVQYFRDEWLSLKAKLYDGNMLRMSASERNKVRKGYWKRSTISGKNKWKAPKFKSGGQELKVRISVNPQAYEIVNTGQASGVQVGAYTISALDTSGGIITLSADSMNKTVEAGDVLGVLRYAYDLLKPKGAQ